MPHARFVFPFLLIALLIATSAATARAQAPRVRTDRAPDQSIVYKKTDQAELKLHLYLPSDWKPADRRPTIVFFFGGGYVGGEPSQFFPRAEYFAGRGMVAASAEYRVKNKHGVTPEACFEDARSAVRYLKSHAAELGIDPEKLVAAGGSAGANLAAGVGWGTGPAPAAGDDANVSPVPAALVLYNPAFDRFDKRFTGDPQTIRALQESMLPLDTPPAQGPPALVFYGTKDKWLAPSRAPLTKLEAGGYPVEFFFADAQPHGFFNRPGWHEATTRQTDAFLTRLGLLTGEPTVKADEGKLRLERRAIADVPASVPAQADPSQDQ